MPTPSMLATQCPLRNVSYVPQELSREAPFAMSATLPSGGEVVPGKTHQRVRPDDNTLANLHVPHNTGVNKKDLKLLLGRRSAQQDISSSLVLTSPVAQHGQNILLLCAGPDVRSDSLHNLLREQGFDTTWDIANGPHGDFTDDSAWDPILAKVTANEFAGVFASPPCSTFSRAR